MPSTNGPHSGNSRVFKGLWSNATHVFKKKKKNVVCILFLQLSNQRWLKWRYFRCVKREKWNYFDCISFYFRVYSNDMHYGGGGGGYGGGMMGGMGGMGYDWSWKYLCCIHFQMLYIKVFVALLCILFIFNLITFYLRNMNFGINAPNINIGILHWPFD